MKKILRFPPRRIAAFALRVCPNLALFLFNAALSPQAYARTTAAASAPQHVDQVIIQSGRDTSLPLEIPATTEGISAQQIARTINASDAEDALKYLPSLLVRKRYIGDYNHAVLASRASGTGNSARSLVYVDGILLSNLLGNGAGFTPRWGNVSSDDIARVDVLYGPYSAAYAGNSVGAVIDYVTRMPSAFEAHASVTGFTQDFDAYAGKRSYSGTQSNIALGDKQGAWSWRLSLNHGNNEGQPLAFANNLISGAPTTTGKLVSGAIADINPKGQDWWLIGSTTQYDTTQDHLNFKVALDMTPTSKASYSIGEWCNRTDGKAESLLRDNEGAAVYRGTVNLGGRSYALSPTDFQPSQNEIVHLHQGATIKSHCKGVFDWEVAASSYNFRQDLLRVPTLALPNADNGGAGRVTDQRGTGWTTFSLKAMWRPDPDSKAHTVELGYQREAYKLRTEVLTIADWYQSTGVARFSAFKGDTRLDSLYVQDAWRIDEAWKATIGARVEHWHAQDGAVSNAVTSLPFFARAKTNVSPKLALAYRINQDWTIKSAVGRAVRMPTVSELFQGTVLADANAPGGWRILNPSPNLRAEKSWSAEWSVERELKGGLWRSTLFAESTRDALYSQALANSTPVVNTIQNIDHIRKRGLEFAYTQSDIWQHGLDLSSSLTLTDSRIVSNAGLPASVGKYQPRVPKWRANIVASYAPDQQRSMTLGVRYSGRQFGTLDNTDVHADHYTGFSQFLVADLRLRYRFDRHLSGAVGIDNLNNARYWAFHPYAKRTVFAEL